MRAAILLLALLPASCGDEVLVAHPPTAFAGFDTALALGETAILDGSQSRDPDGDRIGYAWSLVARPSGSLAAIGDSRSPLATLTPDELGTYVVTLAVSDGDFESRDLLSIIAVEPTGTSTIPLSLAIAPRSCNVDADRIRDAPCGVSDRRIAFRPMEPLLPEAVSIEWTFLRLPLGAEVSELSAESPRGPLGELTFVPPRPGEYWLGARLIGARATSPLVVATAGVFQGLPAAGERPLPVIEAPAVARRGQIVLFDGRSSVVPAGERPRRVWSLVADPSHGDDVLTDVATGCPVDECRRLVPSARGTYLVALEIGDGVTAVAALEVE